MLHGLVCAGPGLVVAEKAAQYAAFDEKSSVLLNRSFGLIALAILGIIDDPFPSAIAVGFQLGKREAQDRPGSKALIFVQDVGLRLARSVIGLFEPNDFAAQLRAAIFEEHVALSLLREPFAPKFGSVRCERRKNDYKSERDFFHVSSLYNL
jgi:hypothetical protein